MASARRPVRFESLRRALAGNVIGRFVQVGALLLSAIVLARVLGPVGLGLVAVASSMVRLASIPVEEGAAKLGEREIAGAIGRSEPSRAVAALRFCALSVVLLGTPGALALGVLLPTDPAAGRALLPAALGLLLATVVTAALRGVLRGLGQTTWAIGLTNAQSLLAPGLYLLSVAATGALTPALALWLQAASKVALVPVLVWLIRRYWRILGTPDGRTHMPRAWIGDAAQFALLGLVTVALAEVGTIMLGYLSTPEEAGLFRIASRAFLFAGVVALAAQQAYGPRIARDWQAGRGADLERPARMISVAALAGSLAALAGFALAGRWLIRVAFGAEFAGAYMPALVMIAGAVSVSIGAVSPRLLKMTGEQRVVVRASLLALGTAAGLNLLLVPPFGATGCAVASLVAATLGRVVMNHGVRRHLGFSPVPDAASARDLMRRLRRARVQALP